MLWCDGMGKGAREGREGVERLGKSRIERKIDVEGY